MPNSSLWNWTCPVATRATEYLAADYAAALFRSEKVYHLLEAAPVSLHKGRLADRIFGVDIPVPIRRALLSKHANPHS